MQRRGNWTQDNPGPGPSAKSGSITTQAMGLRHYLLFLDAGLRTCWVALAVIRKVQGCSAFLPAQRWERG
jgi:hypothetical protein